ncbi:hypothetical protein BpHYR1_011253 [Brachionus plicatilis]|uniref:Uncharacterized protein n=1 Tax=Brachionus plicatilis TaxID=10195 RepID=A0A3M7RC86_BRAPC|nr:hypothetical protein BpHYR1_011253 [Brachionus plicatilis]
MAENFHLSIKNPYRRIPHVRTVFSNLTEQQKIILEREKLRAEQQSLLKRHKESVPRVASHKNVRFSLSSSEIINPKRSSLKYSASHDFDQNSNEENVEEDTGPLRYIKIVQLKLKKPNQEASHTGHLHFNPSEFHSKIKIGTKNKINSLNNRLETNRSFKIPEKLRSNKHIIKYTRTSKKSNFDLKNERKKRHFIPTEIINFNAGIYSLAKKSLPEVGVQRKNIACDVRNQNLAVSLMY